nr:hypothetical protein 49p1_00081 [Yersinia frederiksenii]
MPSTTPRSQRLASNNGHRLRAGTAIWQAGHHGGFLAAGQHFGDDVHFKQRFHGSGLEARVTRRAGHRRASIYSQRLLRSVHAHQLPLMTRDRRPGSCCTPHPTISNFPRASVRSTHRASEGFVPVPGSRAAQTLFGRSRRAVREPHK